MMEEATQPNLYRAQAPTLPMRFIGVAQGTLVVVTLLTLSLFIASMPGRYARLALLADKRSLAELGISVGLYAGFALALNLFVLLAHILIAAAIFLRRPNDWMVLFVAFSLVTNGALIPLAVANLPFGLTPVAWYFLRAFVTSVGLISSITVLFIFPDGRFIPRGTTWLALAWVLTVLVQQFAPGSLLNLERLPLPLLVVYLLIFSGAGAYSQVYRFIRAATPTQRQQVKWATLGLVAAALGPLAYYLSVVILPSVNPVEVPNLLYQRMGAEFYAFTVAMKLAGALLLSFYLLLFPLSFAVSVLRYRLWDIDILIRRTLIYSVLTFLLVLIYLASVISMQGLFRAFTGEGQPEFVTVASTLAIAALFVPLRSRVQESIDRRFYRQKYDSAKILDRFSATLRDEVDLAALQSCLQTVVEETMQPDHVSIWIKPAHPDGQPRANG